MVQQSSSGGMGVGEGVWEKGYRREWGRKDLGLGK